MTKEELKERIADLEWEDFEAKTAKSELPKDIWESVSSFSNCYGGWIVLLYTSIKNQPHLLQCTFKYIYTNGKR